MEAAYSDDPAGCLKNVYGQIEEVHYGYGNYYVYAAVVPDYKYIIISFRGSVTKIEVAEEAYYVLKQGQIPFGSGKVSTYFYNVTISLYNGIKDQFLTMKNNHIDYTILVTGHSLGGALAMVLSTYLRYYQIVAVNDILLITMGQPRVVVHLPPLDDNSSFVGEYWHAGLEIFYPDSMGIGCPWTFCYLQDEDDACSDDTYGVENCLENCIISFFTTICILDCFEEFIDDHLYYFGRRVSSHCTTNETNGDANCYQSNPCIQNNGDEIGFEYAQYFKQTGYCYGVNYSGTANLSDAEQQCMIRRHLRYAVHGFAWEI
uniref:Fungal lipase-like domain-containing protein n=1 Tax=Acrobeloides nanus TaxID=290746 RepID=A0A914E8G1_9BILA